MRKLGHITSRPPPFDRILPDHSYFGSHKSPRIAAITIARNHAIGGIARGVSVDVATLGRDPVNDVAARLFSGDSRVPDAGDHVTQAAVQRRHQGLQQRCRHVGYSQPGYTHHQRTTMPDPPEPQTS